MATLIKIDGTEEEIQPKNGKDFKLDELQQMVGDPTERGLIQIVPIQDGKLMVVDEEGLIKQLTPNEKASYLARDFIVGDALVCENGEVQ